MPEPIKYTCSCCGKEHEEWPALAYSSPQDYAQLSETEKEEIAELDDDFCIIRYPDRMGWFVRCTLFQKVTGDCQMLQYGLWASLSEKSFADYKDNFNNENHETKYFGWLCNSLPDYRFDKHIPTTVITKPGNDRPEIVPHNDFDHPFVHDYYNGITKAEAKRRIRDMLERTSGNN